MLTFFYFLFLLHIYDGDPGDLHHDFNTHLVVTKKINLKPIHQPENFADS